MNNGSVYTVPDKPFIIALGTSHTNGDCEDGPITYTTGGPKIVLKTAYEMIAEELGLELVMHGLSGCSNKDLLQATNELAYHGFFNNNCKMFILEARLVDATVYVPAELITGDRYYSADYAPPNTDKEWFIENSIWCNS